MQKNYRIYDMILKLLKPSSFTVSGPKQTEVSKIVDWGISLAD